MGILLKHTFRNIFAKPLRTFLLVVCISFCCFAALLSLDMTGSISGIVRNLLSQVTGSSDLIVYDELGLEKEELSKVTGGKVLMTTERMSGVVSVPEGFVNYFHVDQFEIMTFDEELAKEMRLLTKEVLLSENEAAISDKAARSFSWKPGDEITLCGDGGKEVVYKVRELLPAAGIMNGRTAVFLSEAGFQRLSYDPDEEPVWQTAYVELPKGKNGKVDAKLLENVVAGIEEMDYRSQVTNLADDKELNEMVQLLSMIFLLMFSICFLLVIFVTISVSQRVISERMAVVGTFRSLGLSQGFTTGILLMESALYGVLGGVFGSLIYSGARSLIFGSIIQVNGSVSVEVSYGKTPVYVYLIVILGAALVECACSLKEVLGASKTAIRDVIFNNKDTAYQLNIKTTRVGVILLAASLIAMFFRQSMLAQLGSFLGLIFALAFLFPLLLKFCSKGLSAYFEKREKPIARLAAMEIYARKSTVGSGILCVTAATLALILFFFQSSIHAMYEIHPCSSELYVTCDGKTKAAMFQYVKDLLSVTDVENVYVKEENVAIGEKALQVNVFGAPKEGFKMLTGLKNVPADVADDVFYADAKVANSFGIKVGDEVKLTFGSDNVLPMVRSLRFAGCVDSMGYDSTSNSIVISKNLYLGIFHDVPGVILVKCDDAAATKALIERYSGNYVDEVQTQGDLEQYWAEKESGMKNVLIVVIALGVGLTVIGMISNQLIGFEGRKRECAVLVSTAVSRECIGRMLLLESLFLAGIALVIALPAALLAYGDFSRLMEMLAEDKIHTSWNFGLYFGFMMLLWVVFTTVSIFPMRSLKKMTLAEQIRYE
ncbi:MAG: hypothetical protein IKS85_00650 [Lachnospiraceae bacterium]|nr:hypothetical protein [Lachnospiraceae bacterium]